MNSHRSDRIVRNDDSVWQMDVGNCARCGEDHYDRPVFDFTNNAPDCADYWMRCPTTGDPILVTVEQDHE